jgi:hypothetical protein
MNCLPSITLATELELSKSAGIAQTPQEIAAKAAAVKKDRGQNLVFLHLLSTKLHVTRPLSI